MKIGLYSRILKVQNIPFIQELIELLISQKVELHIYEPYYQQLYQTLNPSILTNIKTFNGSDNLKNRIDYLFSIGGDGTLLNTINLVKTSEIPVLGINLGRLGLLTTINPSQVAESLHLLKNKQYKIDKRTLLRLDSEPRVFEGVNYALNEFTIHKRDTSSMITIHTYVNGIFLNSYWADGIIVATPTGSTAYSLSCGGPIVYPNSQTFIITPVAPHNLNVRPILLPDTAVISFQVEGRSDHFLCTLDSRYETINKNYQLSVQKEDFSLNLVRINNGNNFFTTIRSKLNWGMDSRN